MECRKFQEQITAAVDGALAEIEKEGLEAHLASCALCRTHFEMEKLTRHVVRTRCQRKRAPAEVLQRISEELDRQGAVPPQVSRWRSVVSATFFRPALAFTLACIAVLVIVNNNSSIKTPRQIEASLLPPNDIIKQSLANHIAVVNGEIQPHVSSNKADNVRSFFSGKTQFPVVVPMMNDCTLIGGVLNEFGGETLAHVVYNYNKSEIIYVYETCWKTVQNGSPLHLAQDVQEELKRTQWYATTMPDGRSLVMWTNGTTLCSAVSRLDEATLLACLGAAR